jgi:hypothetical protein
MRGETAPVDEEEGRSTGLRTILNKDTILLSPPSEPYLN